MSDLMRTAFVAGVVAGLSAVMVAFVLGTPVEFVGVSGLVLFAVGAALSTTIALLRSASVRHRHATVQ